MSDNSSKNNELSTSQRRKIKRMNEFEENLKESIKNETHAQSSVSGSGLFNRVFYDIDPVTRETTLNIKRIVFVFACISFVLIVFITTLSFQSAYKTESMTVPVETETTITESNKSFISEINKNSSNPTTNEKFDAIRYIRTNKKPENKVIIIKKKPVRKRKFKKTPEPVIKKPAISKPLIIISNSEINTNKKTITKQFVSKYNTFIPIVGEKVKIRLEYDFITKINQPIIAYPIDVKTNLPPKSRFYGTVSGNYDDYFLLTFNKYYYKNKKITFSGISATDSSCMVLAEKIGEIDIDSGIRSGLRAGARGLLPSTGGGILDTFLGSAGSTIINSASRNTITRSVYKIKKGSEFFIVIIP